MKNITAFFLVLAISFSCQSEKDFTDEVNNYVQAFNSRNITDYVNFLIPAEYGNNEEYKTNLVEAYNRILEGDERKLSNVQIIHFVKKEDQTQLLFSADHGNSSTFFIGRTDSDNILKFSTLFSSNMRIDQITQKIPELDTSFYDLIEPGWENVIRFKAGERIPDLEWISISGKEIKTREISDQIIVLNFWHTTCAPCIKEIPELNQLVTKYPKVNFVAPISDIDVDYLKDKFLTKYNFNYDVVIVNGNDYNVYSFPKHIVIKDSKVVEIIDGYSEGNISKLEMAILEDV